MRDPPGETRREQQSIELDGSGSTRVNLEMGAGELKVSGGAAKLMEAEFTYNVDRLKPMVEHHSSATEGEIRIHSTRGPRPVVWRHVALGPAR